MTDLLRDLLAELLAESPQDSITRTSNTFDRIAQPFERRMVIFGTGHLGKFVLPAMRRAGIQPLAFCDNNPKKWGTSIDGVEVMSPVKAFAKFGDNACFLAAVYNSSKIVKQLEDLGCRHILPYIVFFWKHSESLPGEERLELPYKILEQASEMPSAYALLADDVSREEFRTQIRWRCLLDYSCLPPHDPPSDMYFAPDLVRLTPQEVLVDCGAYDGDSINLFLEKSGGSFQRIYALEPDPANLKALTATIAALPAEVAAKVEVMPFALGREHCTLRFSANGTVFSKITTDVGGVDVECRALDALFEEPICPTIIKMDIEGAEMEAIPGASKTIARCRPIIAMCAYHRCEHLWLIPKLLHDANPDYRIFLRRYAEECWETVYYAIPQERLA